MFVAMRPLPARPDFPVFGLSQAFTGFRWLALWQGARSSFAGPVYWVTLAHGYPDSELHIVVETAGKAVERYTPTGERDTSELVIPIASTALGNAAERARLGPRSEWPSAIDEQWDAANRRRLSDAWSSCSVDVDGAEVEAHVQVVGGNQNRWAAYMVDLPDVVIGVYGPAAAVEGLHLVDVRDILGDYAAGRGDRADSLYT